MALRPWWKKTYSIIIVPNARAKLRKIKIPYSMLLFSGFMMVTILAVLTVFVVHYFVMFGDVGKVATLAAENSQLKKENIRYEQLTSDISHRLDLISDKTKVLSSLAMVDQVVTRGSGDISGFENQLGNEILDRDLPMEQLKLNDLKATLDRVERSFNEMAEELDYTPSIWPLISTEIGHISSGYGRRTDPLTKEPDKHPGIDISSPSGTPIIAPANGIVVEAKKWGGYGNMIIVDHHNGYRTYYGHLNGFSVKKGDRVERGQTLGFVGNTGKSTSSHLHYEVRLNGNAINPRNYILNHEKQIAVWDFQLASSRKR